MGRVASRRNGFALFEEMENSRCRRGLHSLAWANGFSCAAIFISAVGCERHFSSGRRRPLGGENRNNNSKRFSAKAHCGGRRGRPARRVWRLFAFFKKRRGQSSP